MGYISENKKVVLDTFEEGVVALFIDGEPVAVTPENLKMAAKLGVRNYDFYRNYTDIEIMLKNFQKTETYGLFRMLMEAEVAA